MTEDVRSCYMLSMKKKTRRAGATQTFSVSVDPETKRALRALAREDFDGNVSAAITELAEEARRRLAAGAYLGRHRLPTLTRAAADRIEAEITAEVVASRSRQKRRVA